MLDCQLNLLLLSAQIQNHYQLTDNQIYCHLPYLSLQLSDQIYNTLGLLSTLAPTPGGSSPHKTGAGFVERETALNQPQFENDLSAKSLLL